MKVLLMILDGLGDRSVKELGFKTPLQSAFTPSLDKLAFQGMNGLMYPLSPGLAPSSDLAHFLLLGYSLNEFPGRGLLEATGEGFKVEEEVVLRTSFISVKECGGKLWIVDRAIEVSEEEVKALARIVKEEIFDGIEIKFVYTGKRQGLLFLKGEVSQEITDSDPFGNNLPIVLVQPFLEAAERKKAEKTAVALNHFLVKNYHILKEHPVNLKRLSQNTLPLNFLVTKWAGRKRKLTSFKEKFSFKGVSISSSPFLRGLAKEIGLDFFELNNHSDAGEDMKRRLEKAKEFLQGDYDFVHLHTKAPDEAAHTKNPLLKKEVIEKIDKAISQILQDEFFKEDLLLVITADHSTPSEGTLIHSGEAVPLLFWGKNIRRDQVRKFDEISCIQGCLGQISGNDLMPLILNFTNKIKYHGSRNFKKDILIRPLPERVIPLTIDDKEA